MREEIGRYECLGHRDRQYTVIEYQNYRVYNTLSGPDPRTPTTREFFLIDGRDVMPLDDGGFKIVVTDEILRRA